MSAEKAKQLHQHETTEQSQSQKQVKVQVHKKRWITPGEKFLYTVVSSLAILFSVVVVSYSSSIDQMNRDMQRLDTNITDQQLENENLQYKIKELSNPERIMEIAKENGLEIRQSKVKQAKSVSGNE
ncbi:MULTISPECIES: cell division protein FtsL [Pontibacillus]|uniref:Cell division protein FtsL n=1 Tax=Pontibacillus chungwhensis TaxID=265426 RepID=A0ABY8V4T9_9BACI|nr:MULTISPECIES: cell division protein FtsL [Pontibacillus]MCD5322585.1 cell division protein FtsL [Pontibacillus sp. HN14]WIF99869.1 cell division protein FtsL [Pontibacillus chungwhensis]